MKIVEVLAVQLVTLVVAGVLVAAALTLHRMPTGAHLQICDTHPKFYECANVTAGSTQTIGNATAHCEGNGCSVIFENAK